MSGSTLNILEAVRSCSLQQSVRILNAGSSTAYGLAADQWEHGPIPEYVPLKPVSPYGVSKVGSELIANQYFYDYGIQSIKARFFIHVGDGGTDKWAIQSFCRQIALLEHEVIRDHILFHGNLDGLRDITDINDSVSSIIK